MITSAQILNVKLDIDPESALAGVFFPVGMALTLSADWDRAVRLRNIVCSDRDAQLDTDLVQRNVQIRPGETYRCIIKIKVPAPRDIDLSNLAVELADIDEMVYVPQQYLQIRPNLKQIKVESKAICTYPEAKKVQLTFQHNGQTTFENLKISILPSEVVFSGKNPLVLDRFAPGNKESMIVAVTDEFDVNMTAVADNVDLHCKHAVRPLPENKEEDDEPFQFLDPRSMCTDEVNVWEGGKDRKLEPIRSAYPLKGDCSYQIVIQPKHQSVKQIEMEDVPESINARLPTCNRHKNEWSFDVDIPFRHLFSKPERLYYTVKTDTEELTGVIHLTLRSRWYKHLLTSAQLAGVVTAQGLAVLVVGLFNSQYQIGSIIAQFRWARDYPLLFLPSIPVLWLLLWVGDKIWLRLRT